MTREFFAPAKINLCLHVLGKRPDGYHELAMLMQRVSLADRVSISLVSDPGVFVTCAGLDLAAGEENIAGRAARRLIELSGEKRGVRIDIDKRIPVAAGLGGGSSDAAAVLSGLNDMLGLGLSPETLREEGVKLGADVPFFLFPSAAWATGIGERLEPVSGLPAVWYVLVNPGFAVSTAWVFQNLGLTSPSTATKMPRFSGALGELLDILHNDLESVTSVRHPEIAEIKGRLRDLGAAGVLMSGSGPTVFGVFAEEAAALKAAGEISALPGWRAYSVRPV